MSDDNNSFIKRFIKDRSGGSASGNFVKRLRSNNSDKENNSGGGFSSKYATKNRASDTDNVFANSLKRVSRIENKRSHAETAKRRPDCVFLVRGKDRGKSAWHYVLVDKDKKELFLAHSRRGSLDVADYGKVMYSGWGEDPPQEIVDKVNEEFST
ncbi:hypothetical protein [Wolbachia endosymbiont of Pentidionis agamae]|uniref:hypothetical protein n=1 Tax=Wolbachia endosymbiont of Pentidionis agamae TaxID=3110435 RepID=UPI002FCEA645